MADKKYMGPISLETLSDLIHESISQIQIPDTGLDEATIKLIIEDALSNYSTTETTKLLIQDAVTDALANLTPPTDDIYDGEERVIGTWFGKPLYKRTYNVTIPNYTLGTETILMTTTNDKYVISCDGFWIVNDKQHAPLTTNYSVCWYRRGEILMIVYDNNDLKNKSAFVTLKYTKTTD